MTVAKWFRSKVVSTLKQVVCQLTNLQYNKRSRIGFAVIHRSFGVLPSEDMGAPFSERDASWPRSDHL